MDVPFDDLKTPTWNTDRVSLELDVCEAKHANVSLDCIICVTKFVPKIVYDQKYTEAFSFSMLMETL